MPHLIFELRRLRDRLDNLLPEQFLVAVPCAEARTTLQCVVVNCPERLAEGSPSSLGPLMAAS
jgi:hypothetical protein